jgi:large subunit ribosomal protein L9
MQEVKKEHRALAERIEVTTLDFTARAGETGKLYGSITTADITDQLNGALGTDIDRRIIVSDPLRQLGEHKITVRLSRDFQPEVTVFVNQFEEEVEEEEAEVDVVDVVVDLDSDEVTVETSELEVTDEASEIDEQIMESELEEADPDETIVDEDNIEPEADDAEANEVFAEEEA